MASKEVAVVEAGTESSFLALRTNTDELRALIYENLGAEGIQVHELDRVKVPAGGGTMWEVPTLDGTEGTKAINGVIIERITRRAYWTSEYDGSNDPPECKSDDGLYGEGDPGGSCSACPFNEFGTSKGGEGQGKACQEFRLLFVLPADSLIPIVIKVPSGSLQPFKAYSLRLLRAQLSPLHVVTRIGLEKATSKDGIIYSKITFEAGERLTPDALTSMRAYAELVKPAAAQVEVEREDVLA